MEHLEIIKPVVAFNLSDYHLKGETLIEQKRMIKELKGIYLDQSAFSEMDPDTIAYTVQSWLPVGEGTPGGLFFGVSTIMPGKVGNEYFMTKGHFHANSDRAEFYWGVQGQGMLIMMDRNRKTWAEVVYPGSLHYIGGEIAHRLANTGEVPLIVGACWPSDAGHDYGAIASHGFSARLMEREGKPALISEG